ncbi:hypothetical protein KJ756_02490 [Patescibacteria group bacterium]|nr:hypothetical protein [Patescibacteria group bacterium]MBU2579370.1 hypothetical protein [Patescibacteria group bacterium]MBU4030997.1 hypothetical protein [Patescibacteria group bacterium]MBU4082814.1 hypothetical protein [Patescibacteria group bacterium]MCG2808908.1 hypothetical protein [Candidatus Portnoybacteria bacterium]
MARIGFDLIKKKDFFRSDIGTRERGNISEKKVEEALGRLKRKRLIVNFFKTSTIKSIDKRKIDFIVIIIKGAYHLAVGLNAKSSWIGALEHENITARARTRGRGRRNMFSRIPAVIVNERDSVEDLCVKILKKIRNES